MENYENNYETPETEANPYGQDFVNYQAQNISKEDFVKNHVSLNKTIKVVAIVSYVFIGLISSAGPIGWMWIVFAVIYLTQFSKAKKEYHSIYGA